MRVFLLVANLSYSRRLFVKAFLEERDNARPDCPPPLLKQRGTARGAAADPFDRMLIAQAQLEDYAVRRVW